MLRIDKIFFSIFIVVGIVFCGVSEIHAKEADVLKIYDNGTVKLDIRKNIENKLNNYIKSSIPFECNVDVTLKKYSSLFFIKDKTLKKFSKFLKFNYSILKKKYTVLVEGRYFHTKHYEKFLEIIGKFTIPNFIEKNNVKNLYIEVEINFKPIKRGFKLSDIYILNNIEPLSISFKKDLRF